MRRKPASKLSEAQVAEMRYRYDEEGWTQSKLAQTYEVSIGHVGRIVRRDVWQTRGLVREPK